MLFEATWVDVEMITLTEVSEAEKDKYYTTLLICGIYKIVQMNLLCTKQKPRHKKQTYGYQGERRRDILGVWG